MSYLSCGSSGFLAASVLLGAVLALVPLSFVAADLLLRFIDWFGVWSKN